MKTFTVGECIVIGALVAGFGHLFHVPVLPWIGGGIIAYAAYWKKRG